MSDLLISKRLLFVPCSTEHGSSVPQLHIDLWGVRLPCGIIITQSNDKCINYKLQESRNIGERYNIGTLRHVHGHKITIILVIMIL
jgi:hypothetical protein